MKQLFLIVVIAASAFAQDTTHVVRIANTINVDGIRFSESDSTQYLRIYFVGDSIKADYDRMKPDKAVQEFFQLVAACRYRTQSNFFVGDTVTAIYNGFELVGVVVKESASGRILVEFKEINVDQTPFVFKKWFDPGMIEAYVP